MLPTTVHARLDMNCAAQSLAYTCSFLPPSHTREVTSPLVTTTLPHSTLPVYLWEALSYPCQSPMSLFVIFLLLLVFYFVFYFIFSGGNRLKSRESYETWVRSNRKVRRRPKRRSLGVPTFRPLESSHWSLFPFDVKRTAFTNTAGDLCTSLHTRNEDITIQSIPSLSTRVGKLECNVPTIGNWNDARFQLKLNIPPILLFLRCDISKDFILFPSFFCI